MSDKRAMKRSPFIFCIVLLALTVAVVSLGGILISDMYVREAADWRAQAIAQDIFDLFVAIPTLIVSTVLFLRGSRVGFFLLTGVLPFLLYTFIIYAFGVHFNRFFLLYCLALGLSSYSLIYLLWSTGSAEVASWFNGESMPVKLSMTYLFGFAILFYVLWLSQLIPSLVNDTVPDALKESGLPTNPIHVIDLSVLLPGFVVTALLLRKRHPLGYMFAPTIMSFSIVMTLSIAALLFHEFVKGSSPDITVAIVMVGFSVISLIVFYRFLRNVKASNRDFYGSKLALGEITREEVP